MGNMFVNPSPTELKAETLASACFINDDKGNFTKTNLPDALQLAPIFVFATIPNSNNNLYFAGGNFYGVQPYEGRYDALQPTLFSFNQSKANATIESILPSINGEVRDAKWIHCANNKMILVAGNEQWSFAIFKAGLANHRVSLQQNILVICLKDFALSCSL